MRKLASLMVLVAIAVPANAGWREDVISKTQGEVAEVDAVALLLKSNSLQCSDGRVASASTLLEAQVDRLAQVTDMAVSSRSGAGERYIGQKTMVAISPMVTEARFTLADALLRARCLDEADKIYRDTISTFTGSSYDALRQRAQIGVDDVRAMRTR